MRQKSLKRQPSSWDRTPEASVWDVFHSEKLSQGMHSSLLPYRNTSGGTTVSSIQAVWEQILTEGAIFKITGQPQKRAPRVISRIRPAAPQHFHSRFKISSPEEFIAVPARDTDVNSWRGSCRTDKISCFAEYSQLSSRNAACTVEHYPFKYRNVDIAMEFMAKLRI